MFTRIKHLALLLLPKPITLYLRKWHHLLVVKNFNINDEPDLFLVESLLSDGDTVVDAGANVGVYTKTLSHFVGSEGVVHAFEPVPSTFRVLSHCAKILKWKNVILHNLALSDAEGAASMIIPDYEDRGPNFYMAKIGDLSGSDRLIRVPKRRLDSVLAQRKTLVSFIKIDVEGHEWQTLQGAREIIRQDKPSLLIEISNDCQIHERMNTNDLLYYLKTIGYKAYIFDGEKLLYRNLRNRSVNTFFLLDKHIRALGEKNPHWITELGHFSF